VALRSEGEVEEALEGERELPFKQLDWRFNEKSEF
jgi:hypothetical protein